jgi:hypothetical protein
MAQLELRLAGPGELLDERIDGADLVGGARRAAKIGEHRDPDLRVGIPEDRALLRDPAEELLHGADVADPLRLRAALAHGDRDDRREDAEDAHAQ